MTWRIKRQEAHVILKRLKHNKRSFRRRISIVKNKPPKNIKTRNIKVVNIVPVPNPVLDYPYHRIKLHVTLDLKGKKAVEYGKRWFIESFFSAFKQWFVEYIVSKEV